MLNFKKTLTQLKKQSNEDLIKSAQHASQQHRNLMLTVIAHLAEVARRNLFGDLGFSSLNEFALKELRLGSSSTVHRYCDVARLAVEFPEVLDMIEADELTMETAGEVRKRFREEDRKRPSAAQKLKEQSGQQIEMPTAETNHEKTAPMSHTEKREILHNVKNMTREETQRKLSESFDTSTAAARPQSYVKKLGGDWNYLMIALSDEELELFDKLRGLLSHKTQAGTIADTQLRIIMEMLDKHDPVQIQKRSAQRKARNKTPSTDAAKSVSIDSADPKVSSDSAQPNNKNFLEGSSKSKITNKVPGAESPTKKVSRPGQSFRSNSLKLKAETENRCQFVSPINGRQCERIDKLDVDHRIPRSKGGGDELENLQLLCPLHNRTIKRDNLTSELQSRQAPLFEQT